MFRAIFLTLGIFSILTLVAEVSAVGLLWSRGYLNNQKLREIRLTLSGQSLTEEAPAAETVLERPAVSELEVQEARIQRILELESRENELSILKRMTTETANRLISDRQSFDQLRVDFRAELDRLQQETVSAATEQTRAVLMSSPPEAAVTRLSGLTTTEGVTLLRGLPEKTIARILQAFQADPKTAPRGQELFEAIYRGDPASGVIQNARDQLPTSRAPGEPPAT